MSSVKVIGSHSTVVEVPDVIKINELVGGVSTKSDDISVAYVKTGEASEEPWLTMQYCEWLCVLEGQCIALVGDDKVTINSGETAFITAGSTWKPTFPVASTYIAICKPAFRPDRCVREGENNEEGMEALKAMHATNTADVTVTLPVREKSDDVLYHMTTREKWQACVDSGKAYFPTTFVEDGYYTHATAVPSRLIGTANHFYQDIDGEWIILEMSRSALLGLGIITKDEEPLPVGEQAVSDEWKSSGWICPHVYGGIPPQVVTKTYSMTREGKQFTGIAGME